MHDEIKYEVTEDLYKDRRRIEHADIHVLNEAKESERDVKLVLGKMIFSRKKRGNLLQPLSHSSPVSEVSRRRKKF